MLFWTWKEKIKRFSAFLLCVFLCVGLFWCGKFFLPAGGQVREYYLFSSSSQAKISSDPTAVETLFLQGECVLFETENAEDFLKETLKKYRARVVAEELVCGVRSYYCYSPALAGGERVQGALVNLHVAIKGDYVKMGTPLIFGGF